MSIQTLPIACGINRAYALPLAVMLESLKQHLRPGVRPVLHLIHTGLPDPILSAIGSIVETHSIRPSAAQLAGAPSDARFPVEASFPLLMPELLPASLERVLFLDADMLVLGDLMHVWETPLNGHVLAAAVDGAVPRCSAPRGVKGWQALHIPADAPYFNGGVLLAHLALWRERDVPGRARRYLETTREPIDFLHQEALNAVLWDDWLPLDERWNLLATLAGRSYGSPLSEAAQPGVVHFAGRMKPWRAPIGGPFNAVYQRVLDRVVPIVPPEPVTPKELLYSVYDRHLRAMFYPIERYLWRRRLL